MHRDRGADEVELVGVVAPRPYRRREWNAGSNPELLDMADSPDGDVRGVDAASSTLSLSAASYRPYQGRKKRWRWGWGEVAAAAEGMEGTLGEGGGTDAQAK